MTPWQIMLPVPNEKQRGDCTRLPPERIEQPGVSQAGGEPPAESRGRWQKRRLQQDTCPFPTAWEHGL